MPKPQAAQWGTVTVPYTAVWSAEIEHRNPRVIHETWSGTRLAMLSEGIDRREGKPVFSRLHADRCREVVRGALCQMCVRPLPARVVTVNQGQADRFRPLINDGLPMCPGCAAEAFQACPGMQRQHTAGQLRVWSSLRGAWLYAPVVLGLVPVRAGGDERINALLRAAGGQVFAGPKLILTDWRRVELGEMMEVADG